MSSSPRHSRILRSTVSESDVFVLGQSARRSMPASGPVADALSLVRTAEERAAQVIADAESRAAAIVANAERQAAAVSDEARAAGHAEGYSAGHEEGNAAAREELSGHVELVRKAAAHGRDVRDQLAEQAASVVARATMLATRRVVPGYYDEDPARTVAVVQDAIRAAAGQEIVSVRVHPGAFERATSSLVDASTYVLSDDAVSLGGCIINLKEGTLDASLESRLDLMELALSRAGGEPQQ